MINIDRKYIKYLGMIGLIALLLISVVFTHTPPTLSEFRSKSVYFVMTDRFASSKTNADCDHQKDWCGGDFKGLINKLDYIKALGFDAVWITPPLKQSAGGIRYHGYHFGDLYTIDPHLGTEKDLLNLSRELHNRNMYLMIDVVANHTGDCNGNRTDYSCITPFNDAIYFHKINKDISQKAFDDPLNNLEELTTYRLSGLPDLDQNNGTVREKLLNWINWLVYAFEADAIRVDTVMEVDTDFWSDFWYYASNYKSGNNRLYSVLEVFNGDPAVIAYYANKNIGYPFHYPLKFKLGDTLGRGASMYELKNTIDSQVKQLNGGWETMSLMGTFISNHDNPRMVCTTRDSNRYSNLIAAMMTLPGIPYWYQGDENMEVVKCGNNDYENRVPQWVNGGYDSTTHWAKVLKTFNNLRHFKTSGYSGVESTSYKELYVTDKIFVYSRGNGVVVALTNGGSNASTIDITVPGTPFSNGQTVCNLFYPGDCLTISGNSLRVVLTHGEPKVYVKSSYVSQISEL